MPKAKINAKQVNESMKIAIDLYNCTTQNCEKQRNTVNRMSSSFIDAMKSQENQVLLSCQITKCRESAIMQLSNFQLTYKNKKDAKSIKACSFVDKLLANPDKISVQQYIKAVTNFYFT